MKVDMFEKPKAWQNKSAPSKAKAKAKAVLIGAVVAGAALISLGGAALVFTTVRSGPHDEASTNAVVAQAIIGPNAVLLANHPNGPAWLDYYNLNRALLGEPLSGPRPIGVNSECVVFDNYAICLSPDPAFKGTQWEYTPLVLGTESLPEGVERAVDAPFAPVVKAFIDSALTAAGKDWMYFFGRAISQPYCTPATCFQATERQILSWPNVAEPVPRDLRLASLGTRKYQQLGPTPTSR
jgi:hypothetical protein